jgi:lantibiotic biosynthesis protein
MPPAPVERDHGHLPSTSTWAYLKLYGHPDRASDILTRHLPGLLDRLGQAAGWWFVRYRDPHDHLRLRFRLPHPDAFGELAAMVGTWAADLRKSGLLGRIQWDTYYPETGRYGTGEAMAAAETVFAADSSSALAHLRCEAGSGVHPYALASAGLLDLAVSFIGDTTAATRWLVDHITTRTAPHAARALHQEAMCLADPSGGLAAVRALPGGEPLTRAWANRRQALQQYRNALTVGGVEEPETVLPSLMHLNYLRTAGIDSHGEDICSRLVRAAALARTVQTRGAPA